MVRNHHGYGITHICLDQRKALLLTEFTNYSLVVATCNQSTNQSILLRLAPKWPPLNHSPLSQVDSIAMWIGECSQLCKAAETLLVLQKLIACLKEKSRSSNMYLLCDDIQYTYPVTVSEPGRKQKLCV